MSVVVSLASPVEQTMELEACETSVENIMFFDGVCGLCNRVVDFVLVRDVEHRIKFAPLQGDTAAQLLSQEDRASLKSMVFWTGTRSYRKSSAVVRVLWNLGPVWKIVGTLLWLIPFPLRDLGYVLVANHRYRFFGKKETCRLPTPEERQRFLP